MSIQLSQSIFDCPQCKAANLRVAKRGDMPIAYHCLDCKARYVATWKLLDDDELTVMEQAVLGEETFDLGKVTASESK